MMKRVKMRKSLRKRKSLPQSLHNKIQIWMLFFKEINLNSMFFLISLTWLHGKRSSRLTKMSRFLFALEVTLILRKLLKREAGFIIRIQILHALISNGS